MDVYITLGLIMGLWIMKAVFVLCRWNMGSIIKMMGVRGVGFILVLMVIRIGLGWMGLEVLGLRMRLPFMDLGRVLGRISVCRVIAVWGRRIVMMADIETYAACEGSHH